jgi:hypothetical protein
MNIELSASWIKIINRIKTAEQAELEIQSDLARFEVEISNMQLPNARVKTPRVLYLTKIVDKAKALVTKFGLPEKYINDIDVKFNEYMVLIDKVKEKNKKSYNHIVSLDDVSQLEQLECDLQYWEKEIQTYEQTIIDQFDSIFTPNIENFLQVKGAMVSNLRDAYNKSEKNDIQTSLLKKAENLRARWRYIHQVLVIKGRIDHCYLAIESVEASEQHINTVKTRIQKLLAKLFESINTDSADRDICMSMYKSVLQSVKVLNEAKICK